jgi:hypothetical protein
MIYPTKEDALTCILFLFIRQTLRATNDDILIRINAGLKVPLSAKKVGMLMKKLGFKATRNSMDKRGYWVVVHTFEQIERWRRQL